MSPVEFCTSRTPFGESTSLSRRTSAAPLPQRTPFHPKHPLSTWLRRRRPHATGTVFCGSQLDTTHSIASVFRRILRLELSREKHFSGTEVAGVSQPLPLAHF